VIAIIGLALLQAAAALPNDRLTDIPVTYQGRWALSADFCNDPGPATVEIGPRRISFYERRGYLQMGQLNAAGDTPEFYGRFQFAQTFKFWDETVELSLKDGRLIIDEQPGGTGNHPNMPWYRCS
jgi:hypothetical protein